MMKSADKSTEIRFVQKHLPTKVFDNYSSLPGNSNNICFMHNRFALSERRLLVMGDSFIRSGLTYFSQAFRDIAYVRSAQFQGDMVDLFCPDVIISSNAERYLSRVGADADSTSVLLSGYGVPSYKPSDHFTDAYKAQLSYRHHRKVYALWSHKLAGNALRFWALGEGIPNRQINVVDPLARSFESLGSDPNLTFPKIALKPGTRYALQIEMVSDVSSFAQLYHSCTAEPVPLFSKERASRIAVHPGRNLLSFDLNHPTRGEAFRFDPLAAPGSFRIEAADLVELE